MTSVARRKNGATVHPWARSTWPPPHVQTWRLPRGRRRGYTTASPAHTHPYSSSSRADARVAASGREATAASNAAPPAADHGRTHATRPTAGGRGAPRRSTHLPRTRTGRPDGCAPRPESPSTSRSRPASPAAQRVTTRDVRREVAGFAGFEVSWRRTAVDRTCLLKRSSHQLACGTGRREHASENERE